MWQSHQTVCLEPVTSIFRSHVRNKKLSMKAGQEEAAALFPSPFLITTGNVDLHDHLYWKNFFLCAWKILNLSLFFQLCTMKPLTLGSEMTPGNCNTFLLHWLIYPGPALGLKGSLHFQMAQVSSRAVLMLLRTWTSLSEPAWHMHSPQQLFFPLQAHLSLPPLTDKSSLGKDTT